MSSGGTPGFPTSAPSAATGPSPQPSVTTAAAPSTGGGPTLNADFLNELHRAVHPNTAAVQRCVVADDIEGLKATIAHDSDGFHPAYVSAATLNDDGWRVLHLAAMNNACAIVRWVIEECEGAERLSPTTTDNSWTPMHFAAYNGHERMCNVLRMHDAAIDAVDAYGDTPCDVATAAGHDRLVDILGANIAAREFAARQEEERQRLLREARLYEEKKQEELRRKQDEQERREATHRRKTERVKRNKEIRAALELERLSLQLQALASKERCAPRSSGTTSG